MVTLDRGKEPVQLKRIRSAELRRVGDLAKVKDPSGAEISDRYRHQAVLNALYSRQHRKCCFCEFYETSSYNDIEHYRPKARVRHSQAQPERLGYWWLAWTWSNLMFACADCNRSFKKTWFPLEDLSIPLKPMQKPPGHEKPLLINPFEENPIDYIQFVPVGMQNRWIAQARDGHPKGVCTIDTVGLNRNNLLDFYQKHIERYFEPRCLTIKAALLGKNPAVIAETWRSETRHLLDLRLPFVGLSYDLLEASFPASIRREFDLELIRP